MRGGQVWALDEIVMKRATTEEACEAFQRRYPYHARGVIVYGDATGARMQTSGASDYHVIRSSFQRKGYARVEYRVPKSNPLVRERVAMMNSKLKSAGGDVDLLIDGKCKELIRDLEEVSYRPGTMEIDKASDPARTHLSDALGYLIWEEYRPKAQIGEQPYRLL
jgi:hypothetical protein